MKLYREMIVKSIKVREDFVDLSFEDSSVGLTIKDPWFTEKNLAALKVGQRLFLKGKEGNTDPALWSLNVLEDLVVIW